MSTNAYSREFVDSLGLKFDMILDDGSHDVKDQVAFIELYLPLVAADGILLIEDVKIDDVNTIMRSIPEMFIPHAKVYDRRNIKSRWDDIVIAIDKSQPSCEKV